MHRDGEAEWGTKESLERKECVETVKKMVPAAMAPTGEKQAAEPFRPERRQTRGNQAGCFNCGQTDHWRRDCPLEKDKRAMNQPKQGGRGRVGRRQTVPVEPGSDSRAKTNHEFLRGIVD